MKATVRQLADLVQGRLVGAGEVEIRAARPLESANAGDISFVESDRYAGRWEQSRASAAVVPESFPDDGRPVIHVADPMMAFVAIALHFRGERPEPAPAIDPTAIIDPGATVPDDASVGAHVVVGAGTVVGRRCRIHPGVVIGRNCRVGDDVVIFPGVVIYDDTVVGSRVIIHAKSVLGADGFGFRFQGGKHVKIPQLGHVEIGDDVEIGAATTIDRGTFGPTRVGAGTKIDNGVQVAHNCQIGRHNLLVAHVAIGGSVRTGDYVVLAGQAGIADQVQIGDGAVVGARSGVAQDVPPGQKMWGTPAIPAFDQKRISLTLRKLPEMARDVRRLKRQAGIEDEGS